MLRQFHIQNLLDKKEGCKNEEILCKYNFKKK